MRGTCCSLTAISMHVRVQGCGGMNLLDHGMPRVELEHKFVHRSVRNNYYHSNKDY
jgi:hypothetical protein